MSVSSLQTKRCTWGGKKKSGDQGLGLAMPGRPSHQMHQKRCISHCWRGERLFGRTHWPCLRKMANLNHAGEKPPVTRYRASSESKSMCVDRDKGDSQSVGSYLNASFHQVFQQTFPHHYPGTRQAIIGRLVFSVTGSDAMTHNEGSHKYA